MLYIVCMLLLLGTLHGARSGINSNGTDQRIDIICDDDYVIYILNTLPVLEFFLMTAARTHSSLVQSIQNKTCGGGG